MKRRRLLTEVEAIIALLIIGGIGALLAPAFGPEPSISARMWAQNDVTQISSAVVAFEKEYGYPPATGQHIVGGTLLSALTGNNPQLNPKNIVFLDIPPSAHALSKVSDGVFLDPWGGPYRVAIADDNQMFVRAGPDAMRLKKSVAVWTDPDRHPSPPWWGNYRDPQHRYATSWE